MPDATPHELGGRLPLAFVNTVVWRRSAAPQDRASTYPELVSRIAETGALSDEQRADLARRAGAQPAAAARALADALELREALFRIFSAVASRSGVDPDDLVLLNAWLARSSSRQQLEQRPEGFVVTWRDAQDPQLVIWVVADAAAALLQSDDLHNVKQCPGEQCGWVFFDESRNHSRRWCDTRLCGNRSRVRTHYERHRQPSRN